MNKVLLKMQNDNLQSIIKAITTYNAETWALKSRKKENPSSENETDGKMGIELEINFLFK